MGVFKNFSYYRRWVDVSDFNSTVDLGHHVETLTPTGTTLSEARRVAESDFWKSRLCPNLGDGSCGTPPER